jgi:hypothetical protein
VQTLNYRCHAERGRGSRWRVWGGRPGRTLCYGWLALKRSVRYSGRCVRSALHLDGNLRRCVRPPRPATRPVTMPFARCNATTRPPTSTDCCWVEVVQPSENGAPYNSLVWYHFTSPGERPCPPCSHIPLMGRAVGSRICAPVGPEAGSASSSVRARRPSLVPARRVAAGRRGADGTAG